MRIRSAIAKVAMALALAAGTIIALPVTASAAACYGVSCNGLDPAGRCSGDAITVRRQPMGYGEMELRYSPSCAANWARFSDYGRAPASVAVAQLTVWNPGAQSYGLAGNIIMIWPWDSSYWSKMTDGTKKACMGMEWKVGAGKVSSNVGDSSWESYKPREWCPLRLQR